MNKTDIAIIAVAQNISQDIIERFKSSIKSSSPKYSFDILIGTSDDKIFSKTKILNSLLRRTIDKYTVIIQTDIDLIIPPDLINETFEKTFNKDRFAYHHNLRYIEEKEIKKLDYLNYPFKKWIMLESKFCSGCWNGMSSKSWIKTKGYNEEMIKWGYEDTEFFNRSRRLGIFWIKTKSYPLVHINHQKRQTNNVSENTKIGNRYSDQTDWLFTQQETIK